MRLTFFIAAIFTLGAQGPAAAHGPAEARYLGNEGVLVSRGDTKVLFDAFYAESFRGSYTLVPDSMEQAMMAGRAPFDGVDAIFISHIHPDHFNSRKTIAYMRAHPNVQLYAGLDVIGALGAADIGADNPLSKRMTLVHVERGGAPGRFRLKGLEIEAFAIPHNGVGPMPHYAYRVTLDDKMSVLHLGDSDEAESHYVPYQSHFDQRPTHAAFAPEWLLTSESGRRVLQQRIRPRQTIGIHVEDSKSKASKAGTDLFLQPGEVRKIDSGDR